MKKLIFLLLFLVLFSGNAFGIPPNTQNVNGLIISFPDFDVGKVFTAWEIPVHVYRVSDGLIQNSSVNCTFHVYNSTGNHILEGFDDVPSHVFDYEFVVSNTDIVNAGFYALQVYCECDSCSQTNTDLGGFERHVFEVTNDGYEKNHQGTGLYVIVVLIPLIFALFLIIGAATLGSDHNVLRLFFFLLSVPMVWISLHWSMIGLIRFYNLTELQSAIGSATFWTAILFFVIVTYFIFYWIYKIFNYMQDKKDQDLKY